jgi:hypothetical protein
MATTFDENKKIEIYNESPFEIFLNNPALPNGTLRIQPRGKRRVSPSELQDYIDAERGNFEALAQYLTILDPDAREYLNISEDENPIITNDIIKKKLMVTTPQKIKELEKFLQESAPNIHERVADVARDAQVVDARIIKLLKQYTPYREAADIMDMDPGTIGETTVAEQ